MRFVVVVAAVKRSELARSTPMKPGKPLLRGAPMGKKPDGERKPSKGPKQNKCANRACRAPYTPDPRQLFKNWCCDECGAVLGIEKVNKQKIAKAKAERAEAKRKKDEGMTLNKRADITQRAINRYVLLRDYEDGCISCDKTVYWQGGEWHASHFKSRGASSGLRFHLWNIHKACSQCNWHKGGNVQEYEPHLAAKIGADKVEILKNFPRSREFTHEYLIRMARIFNKKATRTAKRLGLK